MKRCSSICLLLVLTMLLASTHPIVVEAATVKISNSKLTLYVGQSKVVHLKNKKPKDSVTWETKNSDIATVSKNGLIKAKKAGSTTVIAKSKGKKYSCTVTVKEKYEYVDVKINDDRIMVKFTPYIKYYAVLVALDFYDSEDNMIYSCEDYGNAFYNTPVGNTKYIIFDIPNQQIDDIAINEKLDYSYYKVRIKEFGTINYKADHVQKIAIEIKEDGTDEYSIINSSNATLSLVSVCAFYYKEGNLVDAKIIRTYNKIYSNNYGTIDCTNNYIEYDNIEVVPNIAYELY